MNDFISVWTMAGVFACMIILAFILVTLRDILNEMKKK